MDRPAVYVAQSPGGIGGTANEMSKSAAENGVQPIVIVVGIVFVIVIAVVLFKIKRD